MFQSLRSHLADGRRREVAGDSLDLLPGGLGQPSHERGRVVLAALVVLGALARARRRGGRRARPWRVEVHGASMLPSLEAGERLLVRRARRLRVGDVVVVREPDELGLLAVKRLAVIDGDALTVLGDNAGPSHDSRSYGPVSRSAILGRAWWRYYPPDRVGRVGRVAPQAGAAAGARARRP